MNKNIIKISALLITILIPLFTISQINEKSAITSFENKKYKKAIRLFLDLSKQNGQSIMYNYYIGKSYLKLDANRDRAISYLEYVAQRETSHKPNVFFYLGIAYFHSHDFATSIAYLNRYIKEANDINMKKNASKYIEQCLNAQALTKSPLDIKFINLGRKINSRFAEVTPFVSDDEKTLVFSSNRKKDFNIFTSHKRKSSENWSRAKSVGRDINTYNDELVAGYSASGHKLLIHNSEFSSIEDIKISKKIHSKYRQATSIGKYINTMHKEEGATYSKNNDTLFFASNKPGGFGGLDLYYSIKLPNGKWAVPINMGSEINTMYDENYPRFSNDGGLFFFSSKGHNSMGGYDIFTTQWKSLRNEWEKPQNFGFPINNTYDNTNICFANNKRYAYISTIRNSGLGGLDIYKIVFNNEEPENLIYRGTISVAHQTEAKPIKEIDTDISITVINKQNNEVYGIYAYNKTNGSYVISFIPGNFELIIKGKSYITYRKIIKINEKQTDLKQRIFNIYLQQK